MGIVERIKIKCIDNKTNISTIEKELEIGNGVIRRWDERSPGAYQILKIANRLNVSVEWLLTGKEQEDLSPEEKILVNKYRACNSIGKDRIQQNADDMTKLYPALPEGVSAFNSGKTGTNN